MERREFITALGGAAAWPLAARAQQAVPTVGYLSSRTADSDASILVSFRRGLADVGYAEGRNVTIEYRFADGRYDRVSPQLTDLTQPQTWRDPFRWPQFDRRTGAASSRLADPDRLQHWHRSGPLGPRGQHESTGWQRDRRRGGGFVENLAHPGGNITGFMSNEPTLGGKWAELLKEIAPAIARVGFLFNPDTAPYAEPFLRHAESAARLLGMELAATPIHNNAEIEHAIAGIASKPGGGLIILPEATTNTRSEGIIAMAARYRVPAIYAFRYQVAAGGLISYGCDIADLFRGAAVYVDHIFRGEKPADLPVQAPTRFQLVVNVNTAKALGLAVPMTTLLRADELIE
jgi:putative ABC transport system substrate-binding protein